MWLSCDLFSHFRDVFQTKVLSHNSHSSRNVETISAQVSKTCSVAKRKLVRTSRLISSWPSLLRKAPRLLESSDLWTINWEAFAREPHYLFLVEIVLQMFRREPGLGLHGRGWFSVSVSGKLFCALCAVLLNIFNACQKYRKCRWIQATHLFVPRVEKWDLCRKDWLWPELSLFCWQIPDSAHGGGDNLRGSRADFNTRLNIPPLPETRPREMHVPKIHEVSHVRKGGSAAMRASGLFWWCAAWKWFLTSSAWSARCKSCSCWRLVLIGQHGMWHTEQLTYVVLFGVCPFPPDPNRQKKKTLLQLTCFNHCRETPPQKSCGNIWTYGAFNLRVSKRFAL